MRVRGIFDHDQPAGASGRHQRLHVGRLAGEMDRDDGSGARSERAFDRGGIEVERVQVDVGEDRNRVGLDHGRGGRDERVGGNDDFVFRADARRQQRDPQRDRAVDDRDAVAAAVHRGEALLELGNLLAVQPAPLAAAKRAQQPHFLGRTGDGPARERLRANGRAAEKRERHRVIPM